MTEVLFDLAPIVSPDHEPEATIEERWRDWSAANPWVLDALERLAVDWLAAGHPRIGVKALWEVNDFTSRAARDLIARRPEWADRIETRALRVA